MLAMINADLLTDSPSFVLAVPRVAPLVEILACRKAYEVKL
jgi:hypothetical protein